MRQFLLHSVPKRVVITIMMMVALALSPVSASHAAMHDHGKSNAVSKSAVDHVGDHDGKHSHHSDKTELGEAFANHSHDNGSETCCAAVCVSPAIVSEFFTDRPKFSKSNFDWRTASPTPGELNATRRPPKA